MLRIVGKHNHGLSYSQLMTSFAGITIRASSCTDRTVLELRTVLGREFDNNLIPCL